MAITERAEQVLRDLSKEVGEGWFRHIRAAEAADDLLHFIVADGVFDAKIDGLIHAAALTTPYILRHAKETPTDLEISRITSWSARDAATYYAAWQVDFHWKIDTRLWQYLLYTKFMRRSYTDAIRSSELTLEEKGALLLANDRFWDDVEIAYTYRMEVIERSRGFTYHPDSTAGAKDHAYAYRPLVPTPDQEFGELRFELMGEEYGAGTKPERVPAGWPRITEAESITHDIEAGAEWYREAQQEGLADSYLRAKLGERWVPTRITGWEAGILETLSFLKSDSETLNAAGLARARVSPETRASIFADMQKEFVVNRLGGDNKETARLIECQRGGLKLANKHNDLEEIDRFVDATVRQLSAANLSSSENHAAEHMEALEELCRPIHPRYAPVDPVEPLPWHTHNPERYTKRMRRLGYTL